jgi:hypothetical protein
LRVPSVLVPGNNYLLNPLHPDTGNILIAEVLHWPLAGNSVES